MNDTEMPLTTTPANGHVEAGTSLKPRILVVDDSSTIRKSVAIFLKDVAVDIDFAEDGYVALQKLKEGRVPSMILADVLMPRLNGYQLCALVKKQDEFKSVPFHVLSSKSGDVDRAYAQLCGADGYIIKPFQKLQLQNAVKTAINLQST
jgi:twitching motility two-component system response regulator PilG